MPMSTCRDASLQLYQDSPTFYAANVPVSVSNSIIGKHEIDIDAVIINHPAFPKDIHNQFALCPLLYQ